MQHGIESIIIEHWTLNHFQRLVLVRSSCLETVFEVYTGKIKICVCFSPLSFCVLSLYFPKTFLGAGSSKQKNNDRGKQDLEYV